ncbi:MAG: PRTRC system protein B [Bryobacteraceae bacterium]|nr:PRTRC system protein B [Bryobacteraceae bacterium]
MKANIDLGGGQAMGLRGALLVYSGAGRSYCTWHEAARGVSGEPLLGEATALTMDFIRHLTGQLNTRLGIEVLPGNILVRSEDATVWWTPAEIRTMFIRPAEGGARELLGRRFPQPALVWRVRGLDLSVRALAENTRPEAGSKLYVAPYFNTDGEDGSVCQGSMRSPEQTGVDAIPLWEHAFFQSEFTHQTGIRKLTSHPGGFHGLWRSLAGKSRFPARFLTPANETLLEFAQREI